MGAVAAGGNADGSCAVGSVGGNAVGGCTVGVIPVVDRGLIGPGAYGCF